MEYELTLKGPGEKGRISLERLSGLSAVLLDIARDAFQLRTQGLSKRRGKRPQQVLDAAHIELTGIKSGSTVLVLESPRFIDCLPGVQLELDRPEFESLFGQESGLSLVIQSFQAALAEPPGEYLDRGILQDMRKLGQMLKSDNETLILSNGRADSRVELPRRAFEKIKTLESQTPEPRKELVVGRLDLLEHSRSRVKVITDLGSFTGFLTDELREGGIAEYWGKELSMMGTAYFKPGGSLAYLHIERIGAPGDLPDFFRRMPKEESVEAQIERQLKEGKKPQGPDNLRGGWPGDEPLEELLAMLTK
ncbi:MAG: hypothetical protein OHK0039_08210 [Bacteroidia bacterium]